MSSVEADASAQNNALLQGPKDGIVGGWVPIDNINDPYVQEIGRFAVMEHNKESGEHLHFLHVDSGETQVVAGINYRLVIRATRNGEKMIRFYAALVWDKPWEHSWKLMSFRPVGPPFPPV